MNPHPLLPLFLGGFGHRLGLGSDDGGRLHLAGLALGKSLQAVAGRFPVFAHHLVVVVAVEAALLHLAVGGVAIFGKRALGASPRAGVDGLW